MGGPTRAELMERCFRDPSFAREALAHPDWNVRFAAAVAAGHSRDASALAGLAALLAAEAGRPLYTQPPVRYEGSGDATEIAEQVRPSLPASRSSRIPKRGRPGAGAAG